MPAVTTVLAPADHHVQQYLSSKVFPNTGWYRVVAGHSASGRHKLSEEVQAGDWGWAVVRTVVMKMEHSPPHAEWEAARNKQQFTPLILGRHPSGYITGHSGTPWRRDKGHQESTSGIWALTRMASGLCAKSQKSNRRKSRGPWAYWWLFQYNNQ